VTATAAAAAAKAFGVRRDLDDSPIRPDLLTHPHQPLSRSFRSLLSPSLLKIAAKETAMGIAAVPRRFSVDHHRIHGQLLLLHCRRLDRC
jgi:hypothetical protein